MAFVHMEDYGEARCHKAIVSSGIGLFGAHATVTRERRAMKKTCETADCHNPRKSLVMRLPNESASQLCPQFEFPTWVLGAGSGRVSALILQGRASRQPGLTAWHQEHIKAVRRFAKECYLSSKERKSNYGCTKLDLGFGVNTIKPPHPTLP
ncbi:hypothetical protein LY78DRAFT_434787 [Colletotrichum sublineola]|nr:hypothetical protein LY78DRAFT_434787 [Colletotrichum sublineola]